MSVELIRTPSGTTAGSAPLQPRGQGEGALGIAPRLPGEPPRLTAPPTFAPVTASDPGSADKALAAGMARAMRLRLGGCRKALLNATERQECERLFAENAHGAARIVGTGEARRDAAFERAGASALRAYERRRTPPSDDETACGSGPLGECGAEVKVEIFSSTRGLLPNLAKADD